MSAFRNEELSFCGECGTLLPLPGASAKVCCPRCGYQVPVEAFEGVQFTARSRPYAFQKPKIHQKEEKSGGATIQEKCPKCGREEMTFHTAQLRSADEGQTIFYSCKCGHKFSVNS